MKKLSCGVIIINSNNKILGCKGYGKNGINCYDIPKGGNEINETPYQTAIRETMEEAGIDLSDIELIDIGEFKYTKEKNLYLFKCRLDIDLNLLHCDSTFIDNFGNIVPEVVGYKWIDISDIDNNFYLSLNKILKILKI